MKITENEIELGNRLLKYFAPTCDKKITELYTDKFENYLVRRIADKWNLDYKKEMPGKFTFYRAFIQNGQGVGEIFKEKLAIFYFAEKYKWSEERLKTEYLPLVRIRQTDELQWWGRFEKKLKLEDSRRNRSLLIQAEKDQRNRERREADKRTDAILKSMVKQRGDMNISNDAAAQINILEQQKKFKDADALMAKLQVNDELNLAAKYSQRAGFNKLLFNFDKALMYYSKAAALQPKNEQYVADQATLLIELGKNREAMELLKKALVMYSRKYSKLTNDIAALYNSLGYVSHNLGDYDDSLLYYKKAEAMYIKLFGRNHPKTALVYNNLGALLKVKGDLLKAMRYFEKALTIDEGVLGPKHENVAYRYNNIGIILLAQHNYSKALEYFNRSNSIFVSHYGELHPLVASCNLNISSVYFHWHDFSNAHYYIDLAMTQYNILYKGIHPQKALCLFEIGLIYEGEKKFSEALKSYQKALKIDQKCNEMDHPAIARDYKGIASAYAGLGKWEKAFHYAEHSLKICLKRPEAKKEIITELKRAISIYDKKLTTLARKQA